MNELGSRPDVDGSIEESPGNSAASYVLAQLVVLKQHKTTAPLTFQRNLKIIHFKKYLNHHLYKRKPNTCMDNTFYTKVSL